MKKYSIVTIALFLCLSMFFHTSAIAIETLVPDTVYWEDKIDESVYESPIYENGKRLIYIQRESIPQEIIAKNLRQKYNYRMDVYEDVILYEEQIVPAVTARVVAELGETAAQIQQIGDAISPVDRALSDDYNDYIMAKRAAVEELYTASTNAFLESNIDDPADVLYQGCYTASFVLYATDSEIEKYAKCADVTAIYPFENEIILPDTTLEETEELDSSNSVASTFSSSPVPLDHIQIGVDSSTGTKSAAYNSGSGYKGDGVKIGVLETGNRYDANAPQLEGIPSTRLEYIGDPDSTDEVPVDSHATIVTSIIVGQAYTYMGRTYEGVVPNATVYQCSFSSTTDLLNAYNMLISEGVSVINQSGGTYTTDETVWGTYRGGDGELDALVASTGVTVVKTAGNFRNGMTVAYVPAPGKAFNVITVGNATTLFSPSYAATLPYTVDDTSCYVENSNLPNKPDIVAPGHCVTALYLEENNEVAVNLESVTSYAAPLVTGVVAQLHQASPALRSNPTLTKAVVLAGADSSVISTVNNPTTENPYLRDKSGAGLVNAKNAMDIVLNYRCSATSFALNSSVNSIEYADVFTIPAGKTAKIMVVFNKPDRDQVSTSGYGNNVNFSVYDWTTDEYVDSSNCIYNNVETVEITAPENQSKNIYINLILQSRAHETSTDVLKIGIAVGLFD